MELTRMRDNTHPCKFSNPLEKQSPFVAYCSLANSFAVERQDASFLATLQWRAGQSGADENLGPKGKHERAENRMEIPLSFILTNILRADLSWHSSKRQTFKESGFTGSFFLPWERKARKMDGLNGHGCSPIHHHASKSQP